MGLLSLYNYRPHYLRDIVNRQLTLPATMPSKQLSPNSPQDSHSKRQRLNNDKDQHYTVLKARPNKYKTTIHCKILVPKGLPRLN